ncbi:hypothetical protein NDI44_27175 [Trichocoleus sp. DQ-A3]|uniref:hypothetical protein n=1 Tax=Cyanophyceae TaxID=3028117 RepID=UPI00168713D8|nr:hypothetical protein [Coleofasciculus sp. FACHB-125]MBD1903869.1 hypothetical protein [Coleofasciculus sp. FACHB-125]
MNSSGEPTLSKRDELLLIINALVEIDERLPGTRNRINFSGSLFSSDHTGYLAEQCEQVADWSATQLIEFAYLKLQELRQRYE